MAQDTELRYMVSTVVSLAQFYQIDKITDTICSLMMDGNDYSDGVGYKYDVQRAPIKAVTSKIVESITRNVVNAGHQFGGTPEELGHLHVHTLDYQTFAGIVRGITTTDGDVVLKSETFIGDITTWLFYHFDGRIDVVVDQRFLLTKQLGPFPQVNNTGYQRGLPRPVHLLPSRGCNQSICIYRRRLPSYLSSRRT
jgi:hypothetical protein